MGDVKVEVRYKREMTHNYMIISAPEGGSGYECRMLSGNAIGGLLRFREQGTGSRREFYYEITSKQPLARLLERRTLKGNEIRTILLGIHGVISRVEEYLLREEQLLLDPEFIYVDPEQMKVSLCLLPGRVSDTPSELSALLKFLLSKVDQEDMEGVVLAYHLYQESLKENYGMEDLLRCLKPGGGGAARSSSERFGMGRHDLEECGTGCQGLEPYGIGRQGLEECGTGRQGSDQFGMGHQSSVWFETGKSELKQSEIGRQGTEWSGQAGTDPGRWKGEDWKEERESWEADKTDFGESRPNGRRMKGAAAEAIPFGGETHLGSRKILLLILCCAAAEGVLWYLMGMEGVRRFGIWPAAAGVVGAAVCAVKGWGKSGKNRGEQKQRMGGDDPGGAVRPDPGWMLEPKTEEAYEEERQRRQWEQMERSREAGTVLLADLERKKIPAVLEALGSGTPSIEIPYVPFIIGKHPELADYCLDCPAVSRLHVRINQTEQGFEVTDLNSTNGTVVNGYCLQANETVGIQRGDVLYLADLGFKFTENTIE